MRVRSFAPIADARARILILGSMPGVESLRRQQYYAHPHNRFWPLLGELLGFDAHARYETRARALIRSRVALWDVLKHCERTGSLDSSIRAGMANDFARFFSAHPAIQVVFFNGLTAEASYRRLVLPGLAGKTLRYETLPSTSPANAGISLAKKKRVWAQIKTALE